MIYLLIGMGLFFTFFGYVLNERNSRYLLAGYNTMSETEREKVDLKGFIDYHRKFHLLLGFSFMVFGWFFHHFVGKGSTLAFMVGYPIVLYGFFTWDSQKFFKEGKNKASLKIAAAMLAFSVFVLVGVFLLANQSNKLKIAEDQVQITGMYGEEIPWNTIESVSMVDELPKITMKSNGFALGSIYKGYFETDAGEEVKLLVHGNSSKALRIRLKGDRSIYYLPKNGDLMGLYEELKGRLE